jgi:hypothetical protein
MQIEWVSATLVCKNDVCTHDETGATTLAIVFGLCGGVNDSWCKVDFISRTTMNKKLGNNGRPLYIEREHFSSR